jgi:hypothetical protein
MENGNTVVENKNNKKTFNRLGDLLPRFDELKKKSGLQTDNQVLEMMLSLGETNVLENDASFSETSRTRFKAETEQIDVAINVIKSALNNRMQQHSVDLVRKEQQFDKKMNEQVEKFNTLDAKYKNAVTELEEKQQILNVSLKNEDLATKQLANAEKRILELEEMLTVKEEKVNDQLDRINQLQTLIIEKDEKLKTFEPLENDLKESQEQNTLLSNQLVAQDKNYKLDLENQKTQLNFEFEKQKLQFENEKMQELRNLESKVRNEVRTQTEEATKTLYLAEIERKNIEIEKQKAEFENEISLLKSEITQKEQLFLNEQQKNNIDNTDKNGGRDGKL